MAWSFERAWEEHGPSLSRIVASYAPPGQDRSDLLQEVALGTLRALPRFRGQSQLRTYLFRIAHNKGVDYLLRSERLTGFDPQEAVADPRPGPAALASSSEGEAIILQAIRGLPLGQRQVLTLALEDLSNAEIAEVLDLTVNNVAVRLHRARDALRRALESSDGS